MNKKFFLLLFILLHPLFLFLLPTRVSASEDQKFLSAKVLEVSPVVQKRGYSTQTLKIKIKNEIVEVENWLWEEAGYNTNVKAGDRIVVCVTEEEIRVISPYRLHWFFLFLFIFFGILFLLLRNRFLRVALSFLFNIAIFIFIFLPLLKKGYPPLISVGIISLFSITLTLILVVGFNLKTLGSALGIFPTLIFSGGLSIGIQKYFQVTGLFEDASGMIQFVSSIYKDWETSDFFGLVTTGAILVVLGIVVDMAVTISSAIHEIHFHEKSITIFNLFQKGMNIGMDVLQMMLSSVLFVFLSTLLPMVLCFYILNTPLIRVINYEFIATFLSKTFSVFFCLIFIVPCTAFASAWVEKKYNSRI